MHVEPGEIGAEGPTMKTKTNVKAGDAWTSADDPTLFSSDLNYRPAMK